MSQTSHEDLCNYSGDLAYAMKKKEWEVGNEYEYKGQEFNVINKINDEMNLMLNDLLLEGIS